MSEKTKTPRELANLYVQKIEAQQVERFRNGESYYLCPEDTRRDYLAGLEAGASLRHEQGHNVVIFEDWWASLEGAKTIDVIDNPTIHCRGCGCDYVADSVEKMQYHYKNCFKEPSK